MEDGLQDSGSTNAGNRQEPLYVAAARRFKREGEDLDSFLARNSQSIGNSAFPGPNCLHPDELCEYRRTGELKPDRETHRLSCDACSAMVEATRPSPERVQAFRQAVLEQVKADEVAKEPQTTNGDSWAIQAKRWLLAVPMVGALVLVTIGQMQKAPLADALADKKAPIKKASPAPQVSVTAQLSTFPQSPLPSVRTQPITVTASTHEVAATVAATAAVLKDLHSADLAAQAKDPSASPITTTTCSSSSPSCQVLVSSYAAWLSNYLEDKKTKPALNMDTWFAEHKETHIEEIEAVQVAFKNGNPEADGTTTRILPTLKTALGFYGKTAEQLKDSPTVARDVNLQLERHLMVKFNVANTGGADSITSK